MLNFGKKPKELPVVKINFLYFHTACGCYKMVPASPHWRPEPYIVVPLDVPTQIVDWTSGNEYDTSPQTPVRRFRLETEEWLKDGETRMFTYREVM